MSRLAHALVLLITGSALAGPGPADAQQPATDTAAVSAVLNDFHRAASESDFDGYFRLFARGGVFLGTDPSERWTVAEFQDYARPHFDAGRGWTYRPVVRHIVPGPGGTLAWFDELLENASLGTTRGSGVLVREDGSWRIALYDLSIPIPNALAGTVVDLIAAESGGEGPSPEETEVREVLEAYYDALSERDWPRFEAHFLPSATLTTVWQPPDAEAPSPTSVTAAEFVERAPEGPDSREIFEERMLEADIRVAGGLATAWVRYRARFGDPGDVSEWEGTDVITMLRHDGAWRIAGLAYEGG